MYKVGLVYIYLIPIPYINRNKNMLEEFTNQILLTPTVYKILKDKAKLKRSSARVCLDIILRELFLEEIKAHENDLF